MYKQGNIQQWYYLQRIKLYYYTTNFMYTGKKTFTKYLYKLSALVGLTISSTRPSG